MEKLKSTIFFLGIFILIGFLGFWAVSTIQSGDEHVEREKIEKLESENEELKKEVEKLKDELSVFQPEVVDEPGEEPVVNPEVKKEESAPAAASKYQDLINELEKLVEDNITIKLKSRGTRVGTIQKFLNIYNQTSNRIDNDYGASTQKAVIEFQKEQNLLADGEAGKTTFEAMIEWLKNE